MSLWLVYPHPLFVYLFVFAMYLFCQSCHFSEPNFIGWVEDKRLCYQILFEEMLIWFSQTKRKKYWLLMQ